MKDRMTLKKELKAIAQSTCKMDTDIFNYFMNNVYKVGFNDREIVYLIWDLLNGYYYEKEDLELYVADFLFNETTIKNHTKFNELYVESYINNCNAVFDLLIKHNIIIIPEVIESAESYFENVQYDIYYRFVRVKVLDEYKNMLNTLKIYSRKQKIEKFKLLNINNKKQIQQTTNINIVNYMYTKVL